jgi:CRP/FNR family transcriptional regulator, cyclic AMP receptor protein
VSLIVPERDALSYFKELDLFRGLSEEELLECKRTLPMFTASDGKLVMVPGRQEQSMYILKEGTIRLFRLSRDGREVTLGELEPGEVFGTLPMFGALSRNTYAVAEGDALICHIGEAQLIELIGRHPDMAVRLLGIVGERLAAAEDRIEDLTFRSAEQRIARSLLDLWEANPRSKLSVSHEEIARRAGVARETVTRMLRLLEKSQVVKTGYRSIRILDTAPLEERAAD